MDALSAAPTRKSSDSRISQLQREKSASSAVDAVRLTAALSTVMSNGELTPQSRRYSFEDTCRLTSVERADLHTLFRLLVARCRSTTLFAGPESLTDPEPEPKPGDRIMSRAEFQMIFSSGANPALVHRLFDMLCSADGVSFEGFSEGLAPLVAADATHYDRLRFLFEACDLDGSGHISRDELFVLLHQACGLSAEYIEPVVESTMQQLDTDSDGQISWAEFEAHYAERPAVLLRLTETLGLNVNFLTARLILSLDAVGLTPPNEVRMPGSTSKVVTVLAAMPATGAERDASNRQVRPGRRLSIDAPQSMRRGAPPARLRQDTALFDCPRGCPSPPRPACVLHARMQTRAGGIKEIDTHRPARPTPRSRDKPSARDEAKAREAAERLKQDRADADRAAAERNREQAARVTSGGQAHEGQRGGAVPHDKAGGWARSFSSLASLHTTTSRRTEGAIERATERTDRSQSDARSARLQSSVRSCSRASALSEPKTLAE
jgi:Ca2+-binding EF-hand superfamily protein